MLWNGLNYFSTSRYFFIYIDIIKPVISTDDPGYIRKFSNPGKFPYISSHPSNSMTLLLNRLMHIKSCSQTVLSVGKLYAREAETPIQETHLCKKITTENIFKNTLQQRFMMFGFISLRLMRKAHLSKYKHKGNAIYFQLKWQADITMRHL